MSLNRNEKAAVVTDVAAQVARSQTLALAEYRGLTVQQLSELRKQLRQVGGNAGREVADDLLDDERSAVERFGSEERPVFLLDVLADLKGRHRERGSYRRARGRAGSRT